MSHFVLLLFYLSFLLLTNLSSGSRLGSKKTWLPDLEFSTKTNWINNEVPVGDSKIKFPLNLQHSVGLPLIGDLSFSSIELSSRGSLLLPLNGKIELTDLTKAKLKNNETYEWKWEGPFSWVDTENWSGSNKAVPHLERIPCSTDMVILPNMKRSLSIKLPNVDVNVKEIKIGKNSSPLQSWDWQELMRGREFSNNPTSVKYSGSPYCDTDQCLCKHNTDLKELLNEICEIEGRRCLKDFIPCQYPIKVEGHCCDFCGGRIILGVNHTTFPLSKIWELTVDALANFDKLSYHARVTQHDGNVEVLLTETDLYTGLQSAEAVDALRRKFIENGMEIITYGATGEALKGSPTATILGPLFGIPLVLILLIFVSIPYFGYTYKEVYMIFRASVREGNIPANEALPTDSFGFARFENVSEGDVQLASAVIPEDDTDSDDDNNEGGKRFENPLYRSKRKIPVEKIIDIDEPVSLAALEGKVNSNEQTSIDSD